MRHWLPYIVLRFCLRQVRCLVDRLSHVEAFPLEPVGRFVERPTEGSLRSCSLPQQGFLRAHVPLALLLMPLLVHLLPPIDKDVWHELK